MSHQYTFHYLNEVLLNTGAVSSASEVTGFICGKIVGGSSIESLQTEEGMNEIVAFIGVEPEDVNDSMPSLLGFILQQVAESVSDASLGFQPLIPPDDSSLVRRSNELGAWCQAFLNGFASSSVSQNNENGDNIPPEIADGLRDLASIAQIEVLDGDETEESEKHFLDLVEYIKVVVLMFYQQYVVIPLSANESEGNAIATGVGDDYKGLNQDNLH